MAGMPQRPAAVLLALLIALPAVGPVAAGEPLPPPGGTTAAEPVAPTASAGRVRPDATGRYIVILRDGADTTAVADKASKRSAVKADQKFSKALKGFTAKLDARQKRDVAADPNVVAVVPDEVTEITAQTVPTSISRVGALSKDVSRVNTASAPSKTNVDADVAIVDTGITAHPDLNLAGGYNCSSTDRSAWRDKNKHGTHVAGTVGAIDNGFGVVGIAPGARVWGVKILNDDGYGLLSWYVCGLDWILAQKDPKDPSRPLFEAVNMSVTKTGTDDHNCGYTTKDVLHRAVCRVVAGGITIVAAAANDHHNASTNIPASYDEVITVSALADTDGRPGGLGGNRCLSWGGYDQDDTFADFSNYGADVDIIAPGKCIWSTVPGPGYQYLSGTSMAAPAVAGAVALYKASRPKATPAEVKEALRYLGNSNWKTWTDPDSVHEPLLDVSRIWALGDFDFADAGATKVEANTTRAVPIALERTETFFERVRLSVTSMPEGWSTSLTPTSLIGWTANKASVAVTVPAGTPVGTYEIGVKGTNEGRTVTGKVAVEVVQDLPTARRPVAWIAPSLRAGLTSAGVTVSWPAATDPTSAIDAYEVEIQRGAEPWGGTIARTAAPARRRVHHRCRRREQLPGPGPRHGRQLERLGRRGGGHPGLPGRRPQQLDHVPRHVEAHRRRWIDQRDGVDVERHRRVCPPDVQRPRHLGRSAARRELRLCPDLDRWRRRQERPSSGAAVGRSLDRVRPTLPDIRHAHDRGPGLRRHGADDRARRLPRHEVVRSGAIAATPRACPGALS